MIPITDPEKIWELRLHLGDLGDLAMGDDQLLSDESYQFFINKATNPTTKTYNFKKALMGSAMAVLANLSRTAMRQRIGQEDIYGKELFDAWLTFIKLLNDPKYSGGGSPIVYFGGVLRSTTECYANNPEFIDPPFYRGQKDRSPYWVTRRREWLGKTIEPEEWKNRYCGESI